MPIRKPARATIRRRHSANGTSANGGNATQTKPTRFPRVPLEKIKHIVESTARTQS